MINRKNEIREDYFPAIDCLRGLFVIVVVLYHIWEAYFPGGWVGVDGFFVISGFVVGSSLLRSSIDNANLTTLISFYIRRVRRLLPATFLCIFLSTICFWLVFPPTSLSVIYKQAIASFFGLNNIAMHLTSRDYFSPDSNLLPFTHLWSLGVEEQFYFFCAFFISGNYLFLKNHKIYFISFLALLSFIAELYTSIVLNDMGQAFFLPQFRFWEIMLGVVLACYVFNRRGEKKTIFSGLSSNHIDITFMLLMAMVLVISCTNLFAKFNILNQALIVYVSLTLVFLSLKIAEPGDKKTTIIQVVIWNKLLRKIGVISFGFYLWHFPIIVFLKLLGVFDEYFIIQLLILPITYLISWGSYTYVEVPLRNTLSKKVSLWIISVAGLCTLSVLLFLISQEHSSNKPKFQFMSPEATEFDTSHANYRPSTACTSGNISLYPKIVCQAVFPNATSKILVLGDSHSGQHMVAIHEAAKNIGFSLYYIDMGDGLGMYARNRTSLAPQSYNETHLEQLKMDLEAIHEFVKPGDILIHGTHSNRMYSDAKKFESFFRTQMINIKSGHVDDLEEKIETSIERMTTFYTQHDQISSVFIVDNPTFNVSPITCYFNVKRCSVPMEVMNEIKSGERKYFERLKESINSLYFLDAFEPFCSDTQCSAFDSEKRLLYYDNNHLNKRGAMYLLSDWVHIFDEILRSRQRHLKQN